MLTLDAIRTAAMADQPWARLDELVRAEMAAGRRVREVAGDFDRLADELWSTPGLPEDGFDAFGDTMDSLTGNCHSKSRYYDTPALPTKEEIAELPRWARVAFAARCALRVALAYKPPRKPTAETAVSVVEAAARLAEVAASRAVSFDYMDRVNVMEAVQNASASRDRDSMPAWHKQIAAVADIAAHVALYAMGDNNEGSSRRVHAVASAAGTAVPQTLSPMRRDFDRLADLARYFRLTDDMPVSQELFGPLWPEGPPAGWPGDPDVPARTELPLTVVARDGVTPARLVDVVLTLFNALNRYHIARTGHRLTLDGDVFTRLAALVPAGAA